MHIIMYTVLRERIERFHVEIKAARLHSSQYPYSLTPLPPSTPSLFTLHSFYTNPLFILTLIVLRERIERFHIEIKATRLHCTVYIYAFTSSYICTFIYIYTYNYVYSPSGADRTVSCGN
jgi:hypothetical protein